MNIHKNARLTLQSRALLVSRVLEDRWSVAEASRAFGVSERTEWKWLRRFREQGADGLHYRPASSIEVDVSQAIPPLSCG